MAKDIRLTSWQWNEIVFEGKNKDYGAYEMRMSSSYRHIIALIAILCFAIFLAFLPALIDKVVAVTRTADNISESTVLANLKKELEEQVQEKDIIRESAAPPPPPLKSTIQFTAPEIVDASEITESDEIKAQTTLAASKVQISVATVEGTDDKLGIDIADLQEHKVIAAEEETHVFEIAEQQPEFPGGKAELSNYLSKSIQYPVKAQENNISGKVILQFVVNQHGDITGITVLRSPDPTLSDEAIRVVKAMPKWIPGRQGGHPVRVRFTLPIDFKISMQ